MSHANLLLYAKATPDFSTPSEKDKTTELEDLEWGGSLDYDNPDNFIDQPERSRV